MPLKPLDRLRRSLAQIFCSPQDEFYKFNDPLTFQLMPQSEFESFGSCLNTSPTTKSNYYGNILNSRAAKHHNTINIITVSM